MEETLKIIKLNVGGTKYTTSLSTLVKYLDSMLGRMFDGQMTSTCDEEGSYFIDADGDMFQYILNFLRRNQLFLPEEFKEFQLKRLLTEAEFFLIEPLIDLIKDLVYSSSSAKVTVLLLHGKGEWRYPIVAQAHFNNKFSNENIEVRYEEYIDLLKQQGFQLLQGPNSVIEFDSFKTVMHAVGYVNESSIHFKCPLIGEMFYEVWGK